MIKDRINTVRRAAVHIQNKRSEGDSVYERCKQHFILKKLSPWFRKINRVNAIIAKFLTILKLQPNRATLRSGLTQAVRKNGGKRRQKCRRFSIFHRISPKRINLRGLGDRVPDSRQAANLSSKYIAN